MKGKVTYVVDEDEVSPVKAFTNGPNRLVGTTNIKKFARNFRRVFGDDKPNACLTHCTDGRIYNGVFKIKSIRKRNGEYHVKTDSLFKDQIARAMEHDPALVDMSFFR